ncbi:MAG TPA: cytochrome P450 [Chthoniobacterales bacterium]|nr:cytochrome P450 [Chthoniobacterales bacterium]
MPATDPTDTITTKSFDPFREPYLSDPYAVFAEARSKPVFYSPELEYWVVTRYDDIRKILPNTKQYSVSEALSLVQPLCPASLHLFAGAQFDVIPTLANNDPPSHTRIRRLATLALTAEYMTQLERFVRDKTRQFLSERFTTGETDLVRSLTWDIPALVILRLLGIPDEDVPAIKPTMENRILPFWGRANEEEQIRVTQWMIDSSKYVKALVAKRAAEPRDDFTSNLLQARAPDLESLTQPEVASLIFGLLTAAHETTTSLLANGFRRLLTERAAWDQICHDPASIPNAVEEILRMDTSIVAWRRKTTAPVEIANTPIPENATLLLLLGSANHDPAVFEDPETFDIHRQNARDHLSFGYGPHYCLGSALARLEARIVFEEVTSQLPSLRLKTGQKYAFLPNTFFRAPMALLVEWDQ